MGAPATGEWRGRRTVLLSLVAIVAGACLLTATAAAMRPVVPDGGEGTPCPALGPKLAVNGPGKPVSAPSTVRLRARIKGVRRGGCFEQPMRVCIRLRGRAEQDLRVRRTCFRRGGERAPLSRKIVFMIRVKPRASGRYRIVARALPIRPLVAQWILVAPRASTTLKVLESAG
jgi:hypothetical protein